MKILFVSTEPVFPPSNGMRIPPANYIKGLADAHEVDFLLLDDGAGRGNWESDSDATAQRVHSFWSLPIRRLPKVVGILREVLGRGPYYGSWQLREDLPTDLLTQKYDAVVGCTSAAIAILTQPAIRKSLTNSPRWIAAMSDLYSLVMAQLALNASKAHRLSARIFYFFLFGLRSRIVAKNEMKMLSNYDKIFVQTEKEYNWVEKKGNPHLASKTICLTNAVDDDLFTLPLQRTGKSLVFVGSLASLYGERFHWFIQKVWRHAKTKNTDLSLTAIGRDASNLLVEEMESYNVQYVSFVEKLADIYEDHDILVAPIFKGYGLINKVVEAMAAGCVVIGDETAFNGIPDFVAGKHGLVANDQQEFVKVLAEGLNDDNQLNCIRQAAHQLMQQHFRWSQRIELLENALKPDFSRPGQ